MPMPVNQKGENILFVRDGDAVEAHIQIQYDGQNATRFAWIVPLQSAPISIGVGSQRLFANLLDATVPQYLETTQNDCPAAPPCFSGKGGGAAFGSASTGGTSAAGGSGGGGDSGPTVTFKATVGSFDVAVLQGGTADEVMKWLADNGYQENAAATPILADYLAHGYLFAAIKLTAGAGVDEIHPIVIKYPGASPCVPLKLTAIAATENMGVRPFFLGDARWVPTNYKHVVLNETRVDWDNAALSYEQAVTRAVDSPVAAGHAFVTEYSGTSGVVSRLGLYDQAWDAVPFQAVAPANVINVLNAQGLTSCLSGYYNTPCSFLHPLVQGILHEFLPVPAGMDESKYYGCLACYWKEDPAAPWDPKKFADALDARIFQPGKRALQLLGSHPHLTRLYTTISPAEMTEDPEFHEHPGPDVGALQSATRHLTCSITGFEVGKRSFALQGASWPQWGDDMPWAETIEQYSPGFPPIVLVDQAAAIDGAVAAWNAGKGWPVPPPPPPMTTCGGNVDGSLGGGGAPASFQPAGQDGSGGCSVAWPRPASPFAWLSVSILALALAKRRRS
jgi:hypothetical protein